MAQSSEIESDFNCIPRIAYNTTKYFKFRHFYIKTVSDLFTKKVDSTVISKTTVELSLEPLTIFLNIFLDLL